MFSPPIAIQMLGQAICGKYREAPPCIAIPPDAIRGRLGAAAVVGSPPLPPPAGGPPSEHTGWAGGPAAWGLHGLDLSVVGVITRSTGLQPCAIRGPHLGKSWAYRGSSLGQL